MDTLKLKQLRVIDALIECGNASKAAIKLNVSPATISYTLGKIRDQNASPLFTRFRGKLIPSAMALELQAKYLELSLIHTEKKEVVISTHAIIEFVLGQHLHSPEENGHTLRFINMSREPEERLNKLRSRIVDVDIGGKLPDDSSIVSGKFIESDICVMASKHHSFLKDDITLEQWFQCGHTRWLRDVGTITSMVNGMDLNRILFKDRVICYESMNLLLLAWVCSRSDYIMLIPRAFVEPLSRFYDIKAVRPPEGVPMKFECFYHVHRLMQAQIAALSLNTLFMQPQVPPTPGAFDLIPA